MPLKCTLGSTREEPSINKHFFKIKANFVAFATENFVFTLPILSAARDMTNCSGDGGVAFVRRLSFLWEELFLSGLSFNFWPAECSYSIMLLEIPTTVRMFSGSSPSYM